MKNSADLGGCDPRPPSASVDNTLLDLQNSSYPTQPHSIIANYHIVWWILPILTFRRRCRCWHGCRHWKQRSSNFICIRQTGLGISFLIRSILNITDWCSRLSICIVSNWVFIITTIIIFRTVNYCLINISFSPSGVVVGAEMVVGTENIEVDTN